MYTKVGASPAYMLSQLTTAVVGAACFIASAVVVSGIVDEAETALFKPVLKISQTQISHLQEISFNLNHENLFASNVMQTPNVDTLVQTDVTRELKKISYLVAKAKTEKKKNWFRLLAKSKSKKHRTIEVAAADVIHFTQAAPVQTPATQTQTPASDDSSEQKKLQGVHQALMKGFRLAILDQAPLPKFEDMNIQVAQVMDTQPGATSDLGLDAMPEAAPVPIKAIKHRLPRITPPKHQETPAVLVAEERPAAVLVEEKPAPAVPAQTEDRIHMISAAETMNTQAPISDQRIDQAAKQAERMMGYQDVPTPQDIPPARALDISTEEARNGETVQAAMPPPPDDGPKDKAPDQVAQGGSTFPGQETISFMGSTLIVPREYPKPKTPVGYPTGPQGGMNTQPNPPPSTHSSPPGPLVADNRNQGRSPKGFAPAAKDEASSDSTLLDEIASVKALVPAQPVSYKATFKEAFDWNRTIPEAQAEILTREEPSEAYGQSQVGWRIARAPEHWPTVYWNHSGDIPLLLKNSAKILAYKASATLQGEAGIVIAKAPAGWSIEFSGRSEHPLLFNEASQPLSTDATDEGRYYVFLNASPGAQILYLVKNGDTGALALPVFGGMVTYLDMSQPTRKLLGGKLLDASGKTNHGLSGVRMQLIGSGQTTVTNGSGVFHFENVITFGSEPIFMEAEAAKGYPHRYKIKPQSGKLSLFYLGDEQVSEWVGQLEGGISTESGMIVGAIPALAAANEEKKPIATIRTLTQEATLSPETYTIAPSGQLLVKAPMSSASSRLLGVQIPEGPAIVQLTDKDGKLLWSELLVIHPRVISVVGPY